jgi:hypothetical protein
MAVSTLEQKLSMDAFAGLPLFQFGLTNSNSSVGTIVSIPYTKTQATPKPKHGFGELVKLSYRPADKSDTPIADGVYTPYRASAVRIEGAQPHPTALAESVAMAAIDAPYPTVSPLLPARVLQDNLASHEQLEALLYAHQAHSKQMDTRWYMDDRAQMKVANPDNPDGKYHRMGFFIGDSTGVGKGRESCLIILANWCEGRKKAIWVSKNGSLLEDARRDWVALGGEESQVVPLSNFALGEKITLSEGILFVTYGGLRTPAKAGKKSRVEQICDWVGADFDGVICFDESHLLGNCVGEASERGQTKASAQGLAGVNLVDRLWNARVTYLSATGAAKVSSLSYCTRLGLWMTKAFPFASRESFVASMESSGVSALEVVSQDFKRLGLYLARTLSFEGVKFETMVHSLTPVQQEIWDTYAEAFVHIHHQIDAVLRSINLTSEDGKCTNSRAKANAIGAFESTKQRFFNALLCAAKAPTLIDAIERDLAAGHACVIQLVSTGAALMDRKLATIQTSDWNDMRAIDFTPREGICDYLMNSFPVHLYQTYQDEHGTTKSELMTDADGNAIVSQEAAALRDGIIERISMLPPINGLLDQINWHFGADRVAEVTGRSKRVIFKNDRYQLSQRSNSSSLAETTSFQADEKQILVFSNAGGTGRSYHASLSCKNQRLRRHYMVETGWEATAATQAVGRSHRSAQAQPPEVVLITTNVKGEARFTSTIASRLSTLGAITKGQRNTGNQGLFQGIIDFSSIYAKTALGEFFADLHRWGIDGISYGEFVSYTGLRITDKDGCLLDELPKMNTFLNRLLALKIDIQNQLFEELERRIEERIAQAKENGTYDRGVQTIYADGGFELIESKLLNKHSSGGETICHTIDQLSKLQIIPVDRARRAVRKGFAYYRHLKNGGLAIASVIDQRTRRDGSVIDMFGLYFPVYHETYQKLDRNDFEKAWVIAEPNELFWKQWQQLIDAAPEFDRQQMYLISGLLLPIWGQLPDENPKVFRLQTNDGQVFLGRAIDKENINKVYQSFGIDGVKLDPDDILKLVWDRNESTPVGQWQLKKNRYKGEDYLEIIAVHGKDKIDWLKAMGCFTEIIDWKTKVFIPIDNALSIITELMPVS